MSAKKLDIKAELTRLKLPLVVAPMFLSSGPELVVASCSAGVVGSFPAHNQRTPEGFEKWIIEFITKDPGKNPLMGWESSTDTYSEIKLEIKSKNLAIEYAKKNNINFEIIEPKKRKITKKSYADNFIK